MRYYLIGYMCSGKTYISKEISIKNNIIAYDLDEEIENYYKMTVSDIFNNFGEDKFRKIESEMLISMTEKYDNCIISTGGGTPIYNDNMNYMKSNGTVIYLKTDVNTIVNRLNSDEINKRPRLKNINNIKDFIIFELKSREKIYNQADIIVNDYEKFVNCKWT